ncbi:MAG: CATRA system-associated protein [Pseudonocardiaceae bacterium]
MTRHEAVPDLDDRTRAHAVELLRDCDDWRLSTARWQQVDSILDRFEGALRAQDADAVRRAYRDLAVAGAFRVPRISKPNTNVATAPERRERINRLIHGLNARPGNDDIPGPEPRQGDHG